MRILLSGGGTAGHINPAIAIAEIIKQNEKHAEIAFVGTPDGMENRLVSEAGYPIYHVDVRGFRRSLSPKNIRAAYLALVSPHAAAKIIEDFCPDAVIGTGGYVSWPLLSAAARKKIPCALHESNALPGLTTRRLAPHMDAIWLNFAESGPLLPKGSPTPVHTGNPLRSGFSTVSRQTARAALGIGEDRFMLLSFGGSRGAERLNEACLGAGEKLAAAFPHLLHIHACGAAHFARCMTRYKSNDPRLIRLPYIDRMPLYMGAADLVICRAGAMTISELALCEKCAVLVPSPYVADDHQYKNAALLASAGAAGLIEEKDLSPESVIRAVESCAGDVNERKKRESAIRRFATPHAGRTIWREIGKLLR